MGISRVLYSHYYAHAHIGLKAIIIDMNRGLHSKGLEWPWPAEAMRGAGHGMGCP
jgi:hypothetical protein